MKWIIKWTICLTIIVYLVLCSNTSFNVKCGDIALERGNILAIAVKFELGIKEARRKLESNLI